MVIFLTTIEGATTRLSVTRLTRMMRAAGIDMHRLRHGQCLRFALLAREVCGGELVLDPGEWHVAIRDRRGVVRDAIGAVRNPADFRVMPEAEIRRALRTWRP